MIGLFLFSSCQKSDLITQKNLNYNKEWESVKDVKMYYDIVKAANHNQIGTRDGISLSLSQALEQIETLYSYTYGTYSIATDSSYSFTDTVEMNFSALPITTNDFAQLFLMPEWPNCLFLL